MRTSTVLGVLLVVAGLLYFLAEFHVVHLSSVLLSGGVLWPLGLAVIGLGGLKHLPRRIPWGSLFLIVLGFGLSLRNSRLVPVLCGVSAWGLFWALAFVFLGASLLTPKPYKRLKHEQEIVIDLNAPECDPHRHRRKETGATSARRFLGDISVGSTPWTLHDMDLWNYVGDIRVNLATAHVDEGTWHLDIGGWVGDVRVLVPHHLPVRVDARAGLGDMTVFDDNGSGTGRHIHYEDPEFADSSKRVVIRVDLRIGHVQVVRF